MNNYKYNIDNYELEAEIFYDKTHGLNIPYTTFIKPLDSKDGFAVCFDEKKQKWEYIEDNRGKTAYNKETKQSKEIKELGAIEEDYTFLEPFDYCKWDTKKNAWVEDAQAKNEAENLLKYNEAKNYLKTSFEQYFEELQDGTASDEVLKKRKEAKKIIKEYEKNND